MGATYTRQSSFTDGDVITSDLFNNEYDQLLAAFASSTGHTHDGTAAEGGPITKLLGTSITIGDATSGTDITVTFDGETNDGVLKWMEDEDYFEFSDDILVASTEKLQFRDTAIYINSSTDGQLDLVADTEIQIAATTIDINGLVDISGNLSVGGNLDVTGTFDLSDSNFTNAGNIQLDSISGDADTNTSITFSGSDVITVATGGSTAFTVNADQSVTFSGNVIIGSANIAEAELEILDGATVTTTELNIIDGDTSATSTTVADADRVVMNDNGTMVQVAVTDLAAYFDDEITAMPNLVTTAATTVGALNSGSITSGFGTIDTGSSTITTTGLISGGSLDIDDVLINGTTIGHTDDTDLITVANGLVTVAGEISVTTLDIGGTNVTSTAAELNILDGVTSTAAELNALDGITAVVGELNALDLGATGTGTALASKAVILDANKDHTGVRNFTITGQLSADIVDIGADLLVGDDLTLDSDASVLGFGQNKDVTLTHVHDTGLLLNSTMALQFNDASQFINAPSATVLDINATDEIELNATLVDVNANLDVSGTYTGAGLMTTGGNIVIPDAGNIGSASDTNAIAIGADGDVTLTQDLELQHDAATLSFGADNDVILTHVADTGLLLNSTMAIQFNDASQFINAPSATVLDINATDEIELNATLVDVNGNLDVSGTVTATGTSVFASLDISGDIDVDGTTNLDVVDIDGAVSLAADVTLETGADIITSSAGTSNTRIGDGAGASIQSGGDYNVFVGDGAGTAQTTADYNTFVGYQAGHDVTTGASNTGVGYYALNEATDTFYNTAIGTYALNGHTGPVSNTAIGSSAMSNTGGSSAEQNTVVGNSAGSGLTTGDGNSIFGYNAEGLYTSSHSNVVVGSNAKVGFQSNVSVGYQAGYSSSGQSDQCTLIGYQAGYDLDGGDHNIFIGLQAGYNGGSGHYNVGIGTYACNDLTSGGSNISIGYYAGSDITSGNYNVCLGNSAADGLSTGDTNTVVGYFAGDDTMATNDNCTVLGANADPSSDSVANEITLGDSNITSLRCNVQSISSLSDERDKTGIADLSYGLSFVNSMRPVEFTWNRRDGSMGAKKDMGFIAQELWETELTYSSTDRTRLVSWENPAKLEADYVRSYPILIKAVQELSAKVTALEAQISTKKGL